VKSLQRDSILERHLGHRAIIVDTRTIRCHDCSHTILLDANRAVLEGQPSTAALLTDEHRGDVDSYGRRPCYRCDKRIKHVLVDDLWEPLPHVRLGTTDVRCLGADQQPATLPPGGWRALLEQQP
jgi:hypothetical protein